jgi:N-sulfoglucosamine sulfohydrolase
LRGAGYRTAVLGKLHVLPPEVYPLEDVTTPGVNQRMPEAHGAAARAFFEQDKDKPFLLLVGIHDPHRSARGFGKASPSPRDPAKVELPRYLSDTVETRRDWAAYLDAIERLDASVGSVLDALDASGRANETLVMFLSDNGPPFPGAKTTLYDPGIRLPLLVARPGEDASSAGRATQALASWVDIAPTALAWAKVPAPESMTGRSLLPLTEDPGASGWERDAVFGSFVFHEITNYYPMRMIRTGKYKLIKNLTPALEFPFASDLHASPSWQSVLERGLPPIGERPVEAYLHRPALELYDLEQDPGETRNLAGEESRRSTVETLERRLLEWRISTKDPWLIPAFDARARVPTW